MRDHLLGLAALQPLLIEQAPRPSLRTPQPIRRCTGHQNDDKLRDGYFLESDEAEVPVFYRGPGPMHDPRRIVASDVKDTRPIEIRTAEWARQGLLREEMNNLTWEVPSVNKAPMVVGVDVGKPGGDHTVHAWLNADGTFVPLVDGKVYLLAEAGDDPDEYCFHRWADGYWHTGSSSAFEAMRAADTYNMEGSELSVIREATVAELGKVPAWGVVEAPTKKAPLMPTYRGVHSGALYRLNRIAGCVERHNASKDSWRTCKLIKPHELTQTGRFRRIG